MDKQQEEFEQWWNNKMAMCFYSQPKSQKETIYHASWLAWQASRASIVVELPDPKEDRARYCSSDDIAYGFNEGVGKCKDVIRSIGLSIKGE
ncbi:hypothetical protein [Serratia marcescens]|uniref:hypothetical protein n=1 Tax=Serratia marcescens TaxID=615 RepID=UPI000D9380FA|nr:hypothetical protein [Serratia marcescens]PYA62704.1 hypothetical protein DMW52_02835 [Serratia marcescens]PYA88118.1 hypothetical protein DMW54_11895 [Serratia marcescens]